MLHLMKFTSVRVWLACFLCLIICGSAFCQFGQQPAFTKDQRELIDSFIKASKNEPANSVVFERIGSLLTEESKYDSAVHYLQQAILLDNDSTYISWLAHAHLGKAFVYLGRQEEGIAELNRSVLLAVREEYDEYANNIFDSIGYKPSRKTFDKDYFPAWVRIEGKNITYNFQDTDGITSAVYKFIQLRERGYDTLNSFFDAKLPRKLVYYVWNDKAVGEKLLRYGDTYISPENCFIHEIREASERFSMIYVLSHWAWGTGMPEGARNPFISVGLGYQFGECTCGTPDKVKALLQKKRISDVLELWKKNSKYMNTWQKQMYFAPVARAFVSVLLQNSSTERFRSLVKNQNLENARVIYGQQFDSIVSEFNAAMGLGKAQ